MKYLKHNFNYSSINLVFRVYKISVYASCTHAYSKPFTSVFYIKPGIYLAIYAVFASMCVCVCVHGTNKFHF